ncbi:N-acetylmuramoyl-L-alanine amidase [Kroppenstedtia sanguinis]|uniref:spore cortex-lytic enzyme n=1 Tax=Kroppenstedtia sanguinis TaxID=1380684 RepID=UPI003D19A062
MKKKLMIFLTVATVSLTGVVLTGGKKAEAAAPTTVYYGSENGDVWDLQARLNQLGYKIDRDGIYGLQTERQVVQFQKDHNLRIDGISGQQTWGQLKKMTPSHGNQVADKAATKDKVSLSQEDRQWMARAVYSEARGEPYKGQVAVASVIINRMQSDKFPNTAKGVIMQKGAFTAVDDGQIWMNPDSDAKKAVEDAAKGWDPSSHALYYFNPDTATSKWIWSRPQIHKIGKHIFTK